MLIAGRPVARRVNSRDVLKVTRLATDGTHNACSMLYAAATRAAKAMATRVQTYTLPAEGAHAARIRGRTKVSQADASGGIPTASLAAPISRSL